MFVDDRDQVDVVGREIKKVSTEEDLKLRVEFTGE